ncbi:MAG: autotransporter-associated beta strand repeat-containing protein [Verrucomicrobia bacterium]|nr:autotransporter-associated beta strand repeat-containing protein [Verrucomicrobiota bacterium]
MKPYKRLKSPGVGLPLCPRRCGRWRALARAALLGLVFAGAVPWATLPLQAATRSWTGDGGVVSNVFRLWSDPDNWNPPGPPQNGEDLWFSDPLSPDVNMINDLTDLTVRSLQFDIGDIGNAEVHLYGNTLGISRAISNTFDFECQVYIHCGVKLAGNATFVTGNTVRTPATFSEVTQMHFTGPIDVNGHNLVLEADVSLANEGRLFVEGGISGSGNVVVITRHWDFYTGIVEFKGAGGDFSGTLILNPGVGSEILLNVSSGVVVNDLLVVTNVGTVKLARAEQIGDGATVRLTDGATLQLNGYEETFQNLELATDSNDSRPAVLDTGSATLALQGNITSTCNNSAQTPAIKGRLNLLSGPHDINVAGSVYAGLDMQAHMLGVGNFSKSGNSALLLQASNSFSSSISIRQGVLDVRNDHGLGDIAGSTEIFEGNLTLRNVNIGEELLFALGGVEGVFPGSALTSIGVSSWAGQVALYTNLVVTGGDMAFTGPISGSGGMGCFNLGTMRLGGTLANTYTGTTLVRCPLLELNKPFGVNAYAGPLEIGQNFGGPYEVLWLESYQNPITPLTLHAKGVVNLNEHVEDFGLVTFNGGTVQTGTGFLMTGFPITANPSGFTAIMEGNLALSVSPANIVVANGPADPDLQINSAILGVNVVKQGEGTLALGGTNTYTGTTTLAAGTLTVEGLQPQSAIQINAGTAFRGSGTVGPITLNGGPSTIAPGNSPGILTCGNFNADALGSGTLQIELNGTTPGSGHDQLDVRGTVNLTGITLDAFLGFASAPNDQFTLIANDDTDAVTGTFTGLPQNAKLFIGTELFEINYAGGTANDVVLTHLPATDIAWTNSAGGDWQVASNWKPNRVPGLSDNVIITNNVTVTLNSSVDCGKLTLGNSNRAPTLTGTGALTVHGSSSWNGGTMSGSGRTIVAPGATLTIGNLVSLFGGRTLENGGTVLWTGGNIAIGNNVSITNRAGALFEVRHAANLNYTFTVGPRFDNAGTFRKTVSAGTTTVAGGMAFNNYGTVEIQSGTLNLGGGGVNDSTFDLGAGTALNLSGGTFTSSAASSIAGAAQFIVSGATANLAGLVNVSGTHRFDGGTANLTGDYFCTNNTLVVSGGTANFSGTGTVTPAVVTMDSGTLSGSQRLTVLNQMDWTGGTMSGSGRTVIPPGATLTIGNLVSLFGGRTLENGGTVLWTGGNIAIGNNVVVTNRPGALFEVRTAASLNYTFTAGPRFDNAGTFRKAVSAGTTTVAGGMAFNNYGTVEILTGTLNLGGGGVNDSTFDLGVGTTLNLSGGTFTSSAASSIAGAAQFIVSGATANLAGLVNVSGTNRFDAGVANLTGNYFCTNNALIVSGGTANFSGTGTVTPAVVNMDSGTLSGGQVVTVLNQMDWTGGTMSGSGRTLVAPGATLTLGNLVSLFGGRTLENGGTVLWTGGNIAIGNNVVVTNRAGALFEVRAAASLNYTFTAGPRFDNAGTFRKSVSAGTTTVAGGMAFNNYHTVEIQSGILAANGGYACTTDALLNCAIGGTTPGTGYGRLQVAGAVTLNGTLVASLINGFIPAPNDSFTVLTAGVRNGTFANFRYPSNEVAMQMSTTANSVIVSVSEVFAVPRPILLPPELSGPDIRLLWTAVSNTTYRLEFNSDLNTSNWIGVPGDVTPLSNTASKLDALTSSNRFYRVRIIPQ